VCVCVCVYTDAPYCLVVIVDVTSPGEGRGRDGHDDVVNYAWASGERRQPPAGALISVGVGNLRRAHVEAIGERILSVPVTDLLRACVRKLRGGNVESNVLFHCTACFIFTVACHVNRT